jgi:hypothetical protein
MNGRSKQMWLLVGLAMALSLGRITLAQAQARTVTTDRSIVINWFASDPNTGELVHFTGSFELVARVYGNPELMPAHVEGFFNAAGVQGESETRGIVIHWKPTGLYRFIGDPNLLPASFRVEATFPLFRAGPGERLQRVGSMAVSFEVTVGLDGGVTSSVIAIILNG